MRTWARYGHGRNRGRASTTGGQRPATTLGCWLLLTWLAVVGALPASADVVVGRGGGTAYAPVIAANNQNGEFLVVWFDGSLSPTNPRATLFRVFGQRVAASGQPIGSTFLISQRARLDPNLGGARPAVVFNPARQEYLVVYDRNYEGAGEPGIFAQRVSASGALRGTELPVFARAGQQNARLAYDSRNRRYFVIWTGPQGLLGLMLSGLGAPLGGGGAFGPPGAGSPALAYNPLQAGYLLVYTTGSDAATDLQALLLSSDGTALAQPDISTATGEQSQPWITVDGTTGQYLVVWADAREPTASPAAYGQLVSMGGRLVGTNLKLADAAPAPRAVYAKASQRFLLVWQSDDPDSRNHLQILGRLLQPDLASDGGQFVVSDAPASGRAFAAISPAGKNALVSWAGQAPNRRSAILADAVKVTQPLASLNLRITAEPNPVAVDGSLSYTLRVRNTGLVPARSVVLRNQLNGRLRGLEATSDQGSCRVTDRLIRCQLGTIGRQSESTTVVTAQALKRGVLRNTASVRWTSQGRPAGPVQTSITTRAR